MKLVSFTSLPGGEKLLSVNKSVTHNMLAANDDLMPVSATRAMAAYTPRKALLPDLDIFMMIPG
jgi:hypothetical protein